MEINKKENNTVFFDIVLKREDIKKAENEVYKKNKNTSKSQDSEKVMFL